MSNNNNFDDDDLDDDAPGGPDYEWFQGPAPSVSVTFAVAGIILIWTALQHHQRVQRLKSKFGGAGDEFRGFVRFSAYISALVDNDDPTFAIARLCGKSTVFLGLMQLHFQHGFLVMLGLLVLESSLDTIRILVAYWQCHSLRELRATSEEDAKDLEDDTSSTSSTAVQLEPTNVYEDLARPRSIATMVFVVQTVLIGFVMYDTYSTTTRSCFNGTDGCPMLASLGSYGLYYMGTFMACVFYVGPMNSYGKKEHDPVFWLKLFVLSKEQQRQSSALGATTRALLSWKDPITEQTKTVPLQRHDVRIWSSFFMSLIVNSLCFHFLLNVLPVQIASKSSIMGIVFSSVGMIYLVDLDDTTGNTLTLVTVVDGSGPSNTESTNSSSAGNNNGHSYDSLGGSAAVHDLQAVKQRILEEALQDMRSKLEVALASGGDLYDATQPPSSSTLKLEGVTHALFLASRRNAEQGMNHKNNKRKHARKNEQSPLMTA